MRNKLWFVAALFISQLLFSIFIAVNKSIISAIIFSIISVAIWYFSPLSEPHTTFAWSINDSLVANFFIGMGTSLGVTKIF